MGFATTRTARRGTRLVAGAATALLTVLAGTLVPVAGASSVAGPGAETGESRTEQATDRLLSPAQSRRAGPRTVDTRRVSFTLDNTNETGLLLPWCLADGEQHQVRARLVGPRREVRGSTIDRVNVLVHDVTTGGWFWNLRRHPARDYASRLARRGETSLVLDRLGYDRSPLADGSDTCLGAQAQMLSELVQHLYSGRYDAARGHAPAATHVVLHGHSAGAAIAQLAASIDPDVEGLVLMSWSDRAPSRRAVSEAATQSATCLAGGEPFAQGEGYAMFGGSAAGYRDLFFASAPAAVRRTAAAKRNASPCGDALSLAGLLTGGGLASHEVDVPVLLLFGGRDALLGSRAPAQQAAAYGPDVEVTTRTFARAGSALPLERQAPLVRRTVLRWLDRLGPTA